MPTVLQACPLAQRFLRCGATTLQSTRTPSPRQHKSIARQDRQPPVLPSTANASAFTLSELTLGATGTSALGAFLNTSSTDMQAQIGAVCLSAAGASTAVAGSGTYWDPGDGVTVRAGVSCPTAGVNTGGGWLFQNEISVYLPIYQSSDASYPNGWTTWVYRGGYDRDSWPTVQAFCLTVP